MNLEESIKAEALAHRILYEALSPSSHDLLVNELEDLLGSEQALDFLAEYEYQRDPFGYEESLCD